MGVGRSGEKAHLRLVECGLIDFLLKSFGDCLLLQHAVLAEEQPVFERKFGEGEADDELLPWEERPVEPAGQTLFDVRRLS